MVKCCPTCGQTLPLPFDIGILLPPSRRELFDLIYQAGPAGIPTERLITKLYGNDPNGGPITANKSIHARIAVLNKQLRPRGWVASGRGKHHGFYVLEKLPTTPSIAVSTIRAVLA